MRRRRRLRRRIVAAGLVAVAGLPLIPILVGVALTRASGTRPQDLALRGTPADFGRSYRTVFLRTGDGVRLSAWHLPPGRPRGCSVVMAHGLFRSRQELLKRAVWTAERGCAVLALDLRRHGRSAAAPGGREAVTSLGHLESLDILAGADFLRRRAPEDRLYFLGISMGAAAAARAGAVAENLPAGVVLDSVFRSVPAVVDQYAVALFRLPRFPAAHLTRFGMRLSTGLAPDATDIIRFSRTLGRRGAPILVIAGREDIRAPATDQAAIFRANGHPDSRMLEIEGAGHGRPCLVAPDVCREEILRFFGVGDRDGGRRPPPSLPAPLFARLPDPRPDRIRR